MVFSKDRVEGRWKWEKVINNSRKKVNQLHSVIGNRNINLNAYRMLLL